jgi:2-polyprenyl-3-methyl-5-hydroxy-6-metoxy-1,4-benzoquinol methylase
VKRISGTEGYTDEAPELFRHYESISAAEMHGAILHLIPKSPRKIVDIGAGTGRDAAWFAEMGHRVVAVEPLDAMRIPAMALHTSPHIEWLDDSLPDLAVLRGRGERFDMLMLTAVWMHLDEAQRIRAMPHVAALAKPGAVVAMTMRHGPVPPGRRMFEVSAGETIELAAIHALYPVLNQHRESTQAQNRAAGITWTVLAFVKAAGA